MSTPTTPPDTNIAPRATSAGPGASAQAVGWIVFLIGVVMLCFVFAKANTLLSAPAPVVPKVVATDPASASNAGLALGKDMVALLKQLLVLLVMCIVGAVFSSIGIKKLFAIWNSKNNTAP